METKRTATVHTTQYTTHTMYLQNKPKPKPHVNTQQHNGKELSGSSGKPT